MPPNHPTPFRIGVLIVPPIQLLDISPIDLFAMATQSYFLACNFPPSLIAQAIPDHLLTLTYISPTGANSTVSTTARLGVHIDASLADPSVAPGNLDLLVIPGPPPSQRPEETVLQFVRAHVESGAELMTICTGAFVAAYAGVLDGKKASGPRGVSDVLEREFLEVEWVDKRYVRDGKVWTSGGITNGMDMTGVYMRQKWPEVADIVLAMADVDVRSEEYGQGKVVFTAWFGWQIFKAWLKGLVRSKNE